MAVAVIVVKPGKAAKMTGQGVCRVRSSPVNSFTVIPSKEGLAEEVVRIRGFHAPRSCVEPGAGM